MDTIRALPARERGRTLSLVAALGVDPDRVLVTHHAALADACTTTRWQVGEGRVRVT